MTDISKSLQNNYLFSYLSADRMKEVESLLKPRDLKAGETLFNMGDPGDELYIVAEGEVAIYAPDSSKAGQEKPIRMFEVGDALGEMALIDNKPRSLSARAVKPSRVLGLRIEDFRRLIGEEPDMALSVMTGLSDRIRYTTEFLNE